MTLFNDYTEITFNWLNKDSAAAITVICKSTGGNVSIKRVAQERGVLGAIKLIVRINGHSWRESVNIANNIRQVVNNADLSNSLTY